MGMGFVLLDSEEVILQGWKCAQRALSPLHIEAEALIWTMSEVINRGYDGVAFESDCQQLMNLIINGIEWPALAAADKLMCRLLGKRRSFTSRMCRYCRRFGS